MAYNAMTGTARRESGMGMDWQKIRQRLANMPPGAARDRLANRYRNVRGIGMKKKKPSAKRSKAVFHKGKKVYEPK
jgi:hypothetical protein